VEASRVIFGNPATRAGALLARAMLLLPVLVLLSGCDPDPYPADMTYPARTDLLVITADAKDIGETFGPGQLNVFINSIREQEKKDKVKFKYIDPAEIPAEARQTINEQLTKVFNTPAEPRVKVTEEPTLIKDLQLDSPTLAHGSLLYRRHCLHCHGVAGDGRGPTALWVNPPPRDYRRGKFKFASVVGSLVSKPRRQDLMRTLLEGIEGTSMPSFKTQPERDLEALISYVMHLSIRGAVEFDALSQVKDQTEASKDLKVLIQEKTNQFALEWRDQAIPISPDASDPAKKLHPYPYNPDDKDELKRSVGRGYELFIGKGICVSCHYDFGRQSKFLYDDWGTLVRPNNLPQGIYRGGRRPIDIYYRVHSGIGPSKMPGAASEIASDPKAMWDLVNFVQALPYPGMLPDNVRQKVYGDRK
jgi:mono/diheme cytochrome c family protein